MWVPLVMPLAGVERGGGLVNSGIGLFDELLPSLPVDLIVDPSALLMGLMR